MLVPLPPLRTLYALDLGIHPTPEDMKDINIRSVSATVLPLIAATSATAAVQPGSSSLVISGATILGAYWDVEANYLDGSITPANAEVYFNLGGGSYSIGIHSLKNSFKFVSNAGKVLGLSIDQHLKTGNQFGAVTVPLRGC
jgi:hypothetical protein